MTARHFLRPQVRGACYVRAAVHPLPHAVLVASHHSVFEELLGISRDQVPCSSPHTAGRPAAWAELCKTKRVTGGWRLGPQVERSEFLDLCSGAKLLAGCEPAFPCHCGHRYGTFSGQLGDLEALYFGEARGSSARWELQLLGAAQAPVGAAHSGRKVRGGGGSRPCQLRRPSPLPRLADAPHPIPPRGQPLSSAIRELLYSEALYNLGIPTARAAALVVSQSESVQRTVLHDGEVAQARPPPPPRPLVPIRPCDARCSSNVPLIAAGGRSRRRC